MCKTVYVCSPSYTDFFALFILFYLMHTVLRKFLRNLSLKYFFRYNLLFIIIQIHIHINTTTFTIYTKLWHHSLITVLKLKGSSLSFNKWLFRHCSLIKDIYLCAIYSRLCMMFLHTHTHTHTHARVRTHIQILNFYNMRNIALLLYFAKSILFSNFWIMSFWNGKI
jgi:hypothetical protein